APTSASTSAISAWPLTSTRRWRASCWPDAEAKLAGGGTPIHSPAYGDAGLRSPASRPRRLPPSRRASPARLLLGRLLRLYQATARGRELPPTGDHAGLPEAPIAAGRHR